jgi:hypothetical protein
MSLNAKIKKKRKLTYTCANTEFVYGCDPDPFVFAKNQNKF